MSKTPSKMPYVVTMYADGDRKTAFYQFPIGTLTTSQYTIFLCDGGFHEDGTKQCTCCPPYAIYVVSVRKARDCRRFPICSTFDESGPDKTLPTETGLDRDSDFNKAQTAWDMLRKEPLYRNVTEKAYSRRTKIYVDARWLQELANKIRRNHPDMEQFDKSPTSDTRNNPPSNNIPNKGGRPRHKKSEWIEKQFIAGLTPAEILDQWDGMSADGRKSIDPKNFHPFVDTKFTDPDKIKEARKKARGAIEKLRPKKDDP